MKNDPNSWMFKTASDTQDEEIKGVVEESIRQWYERTTKKWRMALVYATVFAAVTASIMWVMAELPFLARLQTFNGALTIPVAAGIWMATFVFIFLVPSREASFRSQEWIEAMVVVIKKTVNDQIAPAARTWGRVGERVEQEFPRLLNEFRDGVTVIKASASRLEEAVKKNDKISDEAKPVIEALRRIEVRVEQEIQTGLFEELRDAARSVKTLAAPPPPPRPEDLPQLDLALASLNQDRKKGTS